MPPKIMVMGDSLGQGCRNLSVTKLNCSQCYASIIARQLNWDIRIPAYPHPVLFDLLDVISELDIDLPIVIPGLLVKIRENIEFWNSTAWMQPKGTVHDNIAITGATYADLFNNTAGFYRARIANLASKDLLELLKSSVPGSTFADLHLAITAMFALNPEGDNATDPDAWSRTAFNIVQLRRPETLFVDIGHNGSDSHFFGSGADAIPMKHASPDFGFDPDLYVTTMKKVVDQLTTLNAPDLSPVKVYLSVLPKLSAVAGLTPSGAFSAGYYDRYEPTLSISKYSLSRDDAAALDEAVKNANEAVRVYAAQKDAKNILIVDYYRLFDSIDYKNSNQGSADAAKQIPVDPRRIDNRYVAGREIWYPDPTSSKPRGHYGCEFLQGGFQSIDGMHPSAVGYAKVAIELLTVYLNQPLTPRQTSDIYEAAFDGDPLLSHFPINLQPIMGTLKIVRRAEGSSETIQKDDVPVATAIQMLRGNYSSVSSDFVRSVVRASTSAQSTKPAPALKPAQ